MSINIILGISNILGIPAIIVSKNYIFTTLVGFTIIFSTLHHYTETNEVGHKLKGCTIPLLYNKGALLRYLDISFAILTTLYIIYKLKLVNSLLFIKKYKYFFIVGLSSSFLCDFIVKDAKYYLFLHLIWHIAIYYILYKVALILRTNLSHRF